MDRTGFPGRTTAAIGSGGGDVALLDRMHRALRGAVERLSDADLSGTAEGSGLSRAFLVSGAAAHDLYHAGQIQLLKKLSGRRDS